MTDEYTFTYLYEAGEQQGTVFQIGVRADPSIHAVDSFAVVLFFEQSDGSVVEVAKIDNVDHREGKIHIDRYYREIGAEFKDFDIRVADVWDAEEHMLANWKRFVRIYLDNHGVESRD